MTSQQDRLFAKMAHLTAKKQEGEGMKSIYSCIDCDKLNATLICEECESTFCEECYEELDECPYCEPPHLIKIPKED